MGVAMADKQKRARRSFSEADIKKIKWKADTLFKKIPFDWQFDSVRLFKQGYGDCNSINRAWQVLYHNQKYKSYLVSCVYSPFKNSHTTCIVKKGKEWFSVDYGTKVKATSFKKAVEAVAKKHKSKLKGYAVRDINWKFVNL